MSEEETNIPQTGQAENGELELAEPRRGTIAWLQQQPHSEVLGELLPACHRIPEGASLVEADGGKCRVVRPDGSRCGATRTRAYGICLAHLGGGDPEAGSRAGVAARARLKSRRMLLGIGPARTANPRQAARIAALERAEELAEALVNGPLDDRELGSIERQQAVIRALDATFPLQQMTVELELPADGEGVRALSWQDMQSLASRLLVDEA